MSIQHPASELLTLESSKNVNCEVSKVKSPTKYAIYSVLIETKEFNVMPLSKIPKDSREEGADTYIKKVCISQFYPSPMWEITSGSAKIQKICRDDSTTSEVSSFTRKLG